MKFRHSAVLALLGWYLMVPPWVPNTHEVNKTAPLKQWTIRRSFPQNEGCEMTRDRLRQAALQRQTERDTTGRRSTRNPESFCALCSAQCVADNDPRLAK